MKTLLSIILMNLITFGAISQSINSDANLRIRTMVSLDHKSEKSFLFTELRSFTSFNPLLRNDLELSTWNFDQYHYQYNSAFYIPKVGFGLVKDFSNDVELGFGWTYYIYNKEILSPIATNTGRLTKSISLRIMPF